MSTELTTLKNGLRIVTDRMPSVETVSLGIWVAAGARDERDHETGVAHFLEHMAFKGTKRRSAQKIAEEVESVGGFVNAYTSRENTAYYLKVLKNDIALGMDILADILQNSTFEQEEINKERGVILQEIGMYEDTPDDIIFDRFQDIAFPDQPMGRSILGPKEIVGNMQRDNFVDFVDRHYGTEQMVFVASGNVEHAEVVKLAEDLFAPFTKKSVKERVKANYQSGEYREEKKLEQVHIVAGFEALPYDYTNPEFYAQHLLSMVLGGGMSSRLFQEIREKRGLVYSIGSYVSSYRDSGIFGIYAGTGEKEVAELVPVMCDELMKVGKSIEDIELDRAKAQVKSSLLMGLESTSKRAEHAAQQMLIYGHTIKPTELVERIEAVEKDHLVNLAARLFKQPLTFASIGPVKKLLPFDDIQKRLA